MDSSMVEENGSSAIGDSLGGAGAGGGTGSANAATGSGEVAGGGGRGPSGAQLRNTGDNNLSTSSSSSGGASNNSNNNNNSAAHGKGTGSGSTAGGGFRQSTSLTVAGPTIDASHVSPAALAAAASATNIVHIIPAAAISEEPGPIPAQAQSVIQQNQQSVIQTAAGNAPLSRGVLLVCNKPNSVIHTTTGNLHPTLQIKPELHIGGGPPSIMTDTNSDDTMSDEEASPKKRRDLLTRRPSYRKILSDLGGAEIVNTPSDGPGLHTIATPGGGVVQYSQPPEGIYVPLMGGSVQLEDQSRKREMRLQKNREAARECRRKKKEYIKCLENRVAVLENQNKALIEELKSLKELYCQQKSD
ncbi:cyclic AMP response element-binding protein B-like isoform X2 [Anopheles albimanus]|uniref:cyclic AMP response element-binding protein B-like isoform X2 n=1 Tax=Anopheles albimanus TaxID=7167 RepID=UPI00163FE4D5|nr:cyclic AMP response element-binding protein B-like isoform X2 [Anopheles albimanus]